MAPAVPTDDYYAILEVSQNATPEGLTKAWRRLARKVHPDRCGGNINTTEACALINHAYDTLKDPTSRREYDRIWPSIVASMQGGAGAAKVAAAAKAAAEDQKSKQSRGKEKAQAETPRKRAGESGKPKVDKNVPKPEPRQNEPQNKPPPDRRNYDNLLNLTRAELHTRHTRTDGAIFELNRRIRRLKGEVKKLDEENDTQSNNNPNHANSTNTGPKSWGSWGSSFFSSAPDNDSSEAKKESERLKLNQSHSRRIKEHELQNLQERLGTLQDELSAINDRMDAMKASARPSPSSKPKAQTSRSQPFPKPNPSPKPKTQPQSNPAPDTKTQSPRDDTFGFDEWKQKQQEARKKQEKIRQDNEVNKNMEKKKQEEVRKRQEKMRQENELKRKVEEQKRRQEELKRREEQRQWLEALQRRQEQERKEQETNKRIEELQKEIEAEALVKHFSDRVIREAPESIPRLYAHLQAAQQQGLRPSQTLLTLLSLEQQIRSEAIQRAQTEQKRQEEQRQEQVQDDFNAWYLKNIVLGQPQPAPSSMGQSMPFRPQQHQQSQSEPRKVSHTTQDKKPWKPLPSQSTGSCMHESTGQACFCHKKVDFSMPDMMNSRPVFRPKASHTIQAPKTWESKGRCMHDLTGQACFCHVNDDIPWPRTMNGGRVSPPSWQEDENECTGPACLCHEGMGKCG